MVHFVLGTVKAFGKYILLFILFLVLYQTCTGLHRKCVVTSLRTFEFTLFRLILPVPVLRSQVFYCIFCVRRDLTVL